MDTIFPKIISGRTKEGVYKNMESLFNELMRQYPVLTGQQEATLLAQYKRGDESAKETLVYSNIRLINDIANSFVNCGISRDELLSQGCIGLQQALEDFDLTKGYRLSTYATPKIQQSMRDLIHSEGHMIRVPDNIRKDFSKIKAVIDDFYQDYHREPSNSEIALIMDDPKFTEEKILDVRSAYKPVVSYDADISDDPEDGTLLDVCYGECDEYFSSSDDKSAFIDTMTKPLCDREKDIFLRSDSLTSIGNDYSISKERVRQIKIDSTNKIHDYAVSNGYDKDLN